MESMAWPTALHWLAAGQRLQCLRAESTGYIPLDTKLF